MGEVAETKKLGCDFECGQNEGGDIIIGLSTDPINYGVIGRGLDDPKFISRVSGETSTGQWLEASIAGWTDFTLSSSAFLVCYAKDLTVGKEPSVPPNALKSHLVNFKFVLPLSWHFRGYEITIKKVDR